MLWLGGGSRDDGRGWGPLDGEVSLSHGDLGEQSDRRDIAPGMVGLRCVVVGLCPEGIMLLDVYYG